MHADVLTGPGGNGGSRPVSPGRFIDQIKKLDNVVLSLGWSTIWDSNSKDVYTKQHTVGMESILSYTELDTPDYKELPINFPINAAYALKSQDVLKSFYDRVKKTNAVSYTLQSNKGDEVVIADLKKFIQSYGIENIYIDLSKDISSELNLSNSASAMLQFSLLNLITLFVVVLLRY